jgi:hypothetical protein
MQDFLIAWQEEISPVLTRWIAQAADRLQVTRDERYMLRSNYHPKSHNNFDYGTVFIGGGKDPSNMRAVSFTVTYNYFENKAFYKLIMEAVSSFEHEDSLSTVFQDDAGIDYLCIFYRSTDNFKLKIEQPFLDQIFEGTENFISALKSFPVEVLHDILNAGLHIVMEEESRLISPHSSPKNYSEYEQSYHH